MMRRTSTIASTAITVLIGLNLVMAPATSAAQTPPNDAGRQVFDANCAMCHGNDASGMMGMHPSLRGAVERLSREGVEVTIRSGRDTNPPMPGFEGRLTDQEIDDVIAYIESLPSGPRNFGPEADGRGMMDGMMDGMMGGWMWVLPVLLVIGIVLAIVAIGRGARRSPPRDASPRELLDRRYASGEIDREEYLERRNDLDR